jgi:hypothetical protein
MGKAGSRDDGAAAQVSGLELVDAWNVVLIHREGRASARELESIEEYASMKRLAVAISVAVLAAAGIGPAEARPGHGHGHAYGHYKHHHGYAYGHYRHGAPYRVYYGHRHRGSRVGAALAAGVTGAVIGGALRAATAPRYRTYEYAPYGYGPPPGYYRDPYYGY